MRRAAFFVLILAIGLAGCQQARRSAALDETVAPVRVAASWRSTGSPLSDALLRSAVRIQSEYEMGGRTITGHGTAFGVDLSQYGFAGRRFLLTAAHNVLDDNKNPYDTIKIEIVDGPTAHWSRCRAVAWDVNLDLSIVEAAEDLPGLLRLADADPLLGSPLIMAGSPRGIPVTLFKGTLEEKFDRGSVHFRAKVPFDHGDSGGPMMDAASGRVVGVMVAGIPKGGDLDPTIGLFVPMVGIESFLDAHRRGTPASSPPRRSPVVAKRVTQPSEPVPVTIAVTPAQPIPVPGKPVAGRNRPTSAAQKILDEFK